MTRNPLAIVSAMHEELRALLPLLDRPQTVRLAGRDFHQGEIHGQAVVLVLSGIGKVAAATTAVLLMHAFNARQLVFTGVAGGLRDGVAVGDVVVARQLLQHDMDASPLFPRFEVPLTGCSRFAADAGLADALAAAVRRIPGARLHEGLIVSGDRFVSSAAESAALRGLLPDALAVEMEGAAVAQACADFERPFAVVRTISDRADDTAHVDFARFIEEVASATTRAVIENWLQQARPGDATP
jgi:adenosylhomocysteine nucleosidase